MPGPGPRRAHRVGRWLAITALPLLLVCLAAPAAAWAQDEIPGGDPSPPVALLVAAGVVGVALVVGGVALLVAARRQARTRPVPTQPGAEPAADEQGGRQEP